LGVRPHVVFLHDPETHPGYREDPTKVIDYMLAEKGPVSVLEDLKKEGIVQAIGISGGPIKMLCRFVETGRFDVVIMHNRHNLLYQIARPLLARAAVYGVGVINSAIFASGILASGAQGGGKVAYNPPPHEILKRVEKIETACKRYHVPLAAAALQFSLLDDRVATTAVGMSRLEQVEETIRLASMPIPLELWGELTNLAIRDQDPQGWPV
jgi:D-threo-aldose 1-dehydrogenase